MSSERSEPTGISSWQRIREVRAILQPTWPAVLLVVAHFLLFTVVPQIRDVLEAAHEGGLLSSPTWSLLVSTMVLGGSAWYFARALLYVDYPYLSQLKLSSDSALFESWRKWVPRALGLLPFLGVGITYAKAGAYGWTAVYGLLAGAFLWLQIKRRKHLTEKAGGVEQFSLRSQSLPWKVLIILGLLLSFSFIVLLSIATWKVGLSQLLGAAAIVNLAFGAWIAFASVLLIYPTYRYRIPSLVVVLIIYAIVIGPFTDNHGARSNGSPRERDTLDQHIVQWFKHRESQIENAGQGGYPVYVATAEGGGIRAAYWTALVLAYLDDCVPNFSDHLFGISGVSGGSVGASFYVALKSNSDPERRSLSPRPKCPISQETPRRPVTLECGKNGPYATTCRLAESLSEDMLAPVLGGFLFPDLFNRFFPVGFADRAVYLEEAMESAWQLTFGTDTLAADFLAQWEGARRHRVPSLFLNSTWVRSGSRVVVSNLDISGLGGVKLAEPTAFSAPDDLIALWESSMPASTAAHMSARFTYVSPAGGIVRSDESIIGDAVDGGYFENSGAFTARQIMGAMHDYVQKNKPLADNVVITPLVIINNSDNPVGLDPASRTAEIPKAGFLDRFLLQTRAPIQALFAARSARGHEAELDVMSKSPGTGKDPARSVGRSWRFQRPRSPSQRPPLGWMLSRATQQEMQKQLFETKALHDFLRNHSR